MGKKNKKQNNAADASGKTPAPAAQQQGRPQEPGPSGNQGQSQAPQQRPQQSQQRQQPTEQQQTQGPQQQKKQQQSNKGPQQQRGQDGQAQQQGVQGVPQVQQKQAGQGVQKQSGGQGTQQKAEGWGSKPQAQQQGGQGEGPRPQTQQGGGKGAQQQSGGWGQKPQGQQQQSGQGSWGAKPQAQQQGGQGAGPRPQTQQGGGQGAQQQSGGWGQKSQGQQQQSGQGGWGTKPQAQQQGGQGAGPRPQTQQGGGQGAQQQSGVWGQKPQGQQQQSGQGGWGAKPQAQQQGGQDAGPRPQTQQGGGQGAQQQSGVWGQKPQGQQQQSGQGGWGTQQQPRQAPQQQQQQLRQAPHQQQQQQPRQAPQQQQQQTGTYSGQRNTGVPQLPTMQKSFQKMSISNEQVVPLKDKSCAGIVRGVLGRPGTLEVNYLRLMLDRMPNTAYHYDVTITPDRPKKFLRPAFEQCKREMLGDIEAAFDGNKSCYTNRKLPGAIEHTVEVPDSSNRTKSFKVEIKETKDCEIDMNSLRNYHKDRVFDKPMRAIQALDVILSGNNHERGVRAGRSFFCRPNQPFDLEEGFEAWTGLFQAALLGEEPLINVDIAHKSFPRQSTLLEYLSNMNINPANSLDNYAFKDVHRFLKGITIQYDPPTCFGSIPKNYKVLDIGDPSANLKFKLDDGKVITVAAYYQSKGYTMRYPNLNCIKVGSTIKSIHLPMELCSIVGGQALNRKDGEKQVQKMIKFAATSTNRRKEKIMDILQYFQINESAIVRAFGIQVGSHFIKVPSRVLPAPYMEYLNGQTVTTNRGSWRMDQQQFLITSKSPNGHKWNILYEDTGRGRGINHHELEAFKKDVLKTSQSLSMHLAQDANILAYGRNQLDQTLDKFLKDGIALVFVVLANYGTPYAKIKQSAELKVGILTQCIKENTVRRTSRDRTVFSNVLLKVNAKLNGTNHKISRDGDAKLAKLMEPLKRVMYLGADVTHPSPDQRSIPSVVGVTASHDAFGACYNLQYRLQESKQEHIVDMESIVTHHLKVYHKYLNFYPEQIIYYRDGVSDGQFPIITNVELRAIRNACSKLKINVKLTCIIVVKRHHTRFFPMKQPRDDRDFNNVEPGTVVDQYITHPNEVQFFMVSHQSIQGTAKPTRYNVIVDDSKFDINFLQKLTYNLCHLFPRCNRPVSYPAPAYLAHLVAFRGRVYLEGSQTFSPNLKNEYERRLIRPEFMIRNPMYFV